MGFNPWDIEHLRRSLAKDFGTLVSNYSLGNLGAYYRGTYLNTRNELQRLETTQVGHGGRLDYSASWLDKRLLWNATYNVNYQDLRTAAWGSGGEVEFPLTPFAGLSALSDTPLVAKLDENNALTDANLTAGAGVRFHRTGGSSGNNRLVNCTFYGNTAPAGTGESVINTSSGVTYVKNCIAWDDSTPIPNVTVGLWGANNAYPDPGTLLMTTTTDGAGWYGLTLTEVGYEYYALRGWDKDTLRGVIQNFNLVMLGATFASYLASGVVTRSMWPQFALVAPALLVPVLLGARLYTGISPEAFKRVVLALLSCTGVALLLRSVPTVWARLA